MWDKAWYQKGVHPEHIHGSTLHCLLCTLYLDLCEGEGCNLCGDCEPDDGPAVAVGDVELIQAGLDLLQRVVQRPCDGRQPAIILGDRLAHDSSDVRSDFHVVQDSGVAHLKHAACRTQGWRETWEEPHF